MDIDIPGNPAGYPLFLPWAPDGLKKKNLLTQLQFGGMGFPYLDAR